MAERIYPAGWNEETWNLLNKYPDNGLRYLELANGQTQSERVLISINIETRVKPYAEMMGEGDPAMDLYRLSKHVWSMSDEDLAVAVDLNRRGA